MSSDLFPTVKSRKHVILAVDSDVMQSLKEDAAREDRSLSYVTSRALERDYEQRKRKNS